MADTRQPLEGIITFEDNPKVDEFRKNRETFQKEASTLTTLLPQLKDDEMTLDEKQKALDLLKAKADEFELDMVPKEDGSFIFQDKAFDAGKAAGTFASGVGNGLQNLAGSVAGAVQQGYNEDQKIYDDQGNELDGVLKFLAQTQGLGQKYIGDPVAAALNNPDEAAGAAMSKFSQVLEGIPRETYNAGADFYNAGRGYQAVDPIEQIDALYKKQVDDAYNQKMYGKTTDQLLEDQPAVNFAGDVLPYVLGGAATEKFLGDTRVLKKLSEAGSIYKRAISSTAKIGGVGASEAVQGTIGANPQGGSVSERVKARGEMAGVNATLGAAIETFGQTLKGVLTKKKLGEKAFTPEEADAVVEEMKQNVKRKYGKSLDLSSEAIPGKPPTSTEPGLSEAGKAKFLGKKQAKGRLLTGSVEKSVYGPKVADVDLNLTGKTQKAVLENTSPQKSAQGASGKLLEGDARFTDKPKLIAEATEMIKDAESRLHDLTGKIDVDGQRALAVQIRDLERQQKIWLEKASKANPKNKKAIKFYEENLNRIESEMKMKRGVLDDLVTGRKMLVEAENAKTYDVKRSSLPEGADKGGQKPLTINKYDDKHNVKQAIIQSKRKPLDLSSSSTLPESKTEPPKAKPKDKKTIGKASKVAEKPKKSLGQKLEPKPKTKPAKSKAASKAAGKPLSLADESAESGAKKEVPKDSEIQKEKAESNQKRAEEMEKSGVEPEAAEAEVRNQSPNVTDHLLDYTYRFGRVTKTITLGRLLVGGGKKTKELLKPLAELMNTRAKINRVADERANVLLSKFRNDLGGPLYTTTQAKKMLPKFLLWREANYPMIKRFFPKDYKVEVVRDAAGKVVKLKDSLNDEYLKVLEQNGVKRAKGEDDLAWYNRIVNHYKVEFGLPKNVEIQVRIENLPQDTLGRIYPPFSAEGKPKYLIEMQPHANELTLRHELEHLHDMERGYLTTDFKTPARTLRRDRRALVRKMGFEPMDTHFKDYGTNGTQQKIQYINREYRANDIKFDKLDVSLNLSERERDAFENLHRGLATMNQEQNIALMESALGVRPETLDPNFVTTARNGKYGYKVDVSDVGKEVLDESGVKVFDGADGRPYVLLDYYNSEGEMLKHFNKDMKEYYSTKYPWLYKDGKLKPYLDFDNPNQHLLDLTDSGKLTEDNLKAMREKLYDAGWGKQEVAEMLQDASKGNFSSESAYQRSYKYFVGSLQERQASKIGIAADPIDATRKQAKLFGNKILRDDMVPRIRGKQDVLSEEIKALRAKNTEGGLKRVELNKQIASKAAERLALEHLELEVRNVPDPISKLMNQGVRTATDRALYAEVIMKMGMSMTAAAGNLLQAAAYAPAMLADLKPAEWKRVSKDIGNNPAKGIKETLEKMKASPHSELYRNIWQDSSGDISFVKSSAASRRANVALTTTNIAMLPTSLSVKAGQAMIYRLAEIKAEIAGLKGVAKHDAILEHMINYSQVSSFQGLRAGRALPVRIATFLQNYLIDTGYLYLQTMEQSLKKNYGRAEVTVGKKLGKPDLVQAGASKIAGRDARTKQLAALMIAPVVLGGIEANPVLSFALNGPWAPYLNGGQTVSEELKSDPQAVPGHEKNIGDVTRSLLAYGAIGRTGITPTFFANNPWNLSRGGLFSTEIPALSEFVERAMVSQQMTQKAAENKFAKPGDIHALNIQDESDRYLRGSVTGVQRLGRAATVLQEGKQVDVNGNANLTDIPDAKRLGFAWKNVLGFRTIEEEHEAARATAIKDLNENVFKPTRENYAKAITAAMKAGREDIKDELVRQLGAMGFSNASIESTMTRAVEASKLSKLEAARKRAGNSGAEKAKLRSQEQFEDYYTDEQEAPGEEDLTNP